MSEFEDMADRIELVTTKTECNPLVVEFIRDYGILFTAQKLPSSFSRGRKGACFSNAFFLALGNPDLTYVEGVAMGLNDGSSVHHAWCATKDGFVIENTWKWKQCDKIYFGIPLRADFAEAITFARLQTTKDSMHSSVLEDWQFSYPLIAGEYANSPEYWLEGFSKRQPKRLSKPQVLELFSARSVQERKKHSGRLAQAAQQRVWKRMGLAENQIEAMQSITRCG